MDPSPSNADKMASLLLQMMSLKPADGTYESAAHFLLPREMLDEASELLAAEGR